MRFSTPKSVSSASAPGGPRPVRPTEVWRAYLSWRRSPLSGTGTVLIGLLLVIVVGAPLIWTHHPPQPDFAVRVRPPGAGPRVGPHHVGAVGPRRSVAHQTTGLRGSSTGAGGAGSPRHHAAHSAIRAVGRHRAIDPAYGDDHPDRSGPGILGIGGPAPDP